MGTRRAHLHHLRRAAARRPPGRPHPARRRQPGAARAGASRRRPVRCRGGPRRHCSGEQQGHEPARRAALARPRSPRRTADDLAFGVERRAWTTWRSRFVRQADGRAARSKRAARASAAPTRRSSPRSRSPRPSSNLDAILEALRRRHGGPRRPGRGGRAREGADAPEADHRGAPTARASR